MKTIIGLTGVKGSGKTTCFNFIQKACPSASEIMLAGKLKDVCAETFELPRSVFEDPAVKEKELDKLVVLDAHNLSFLINKFGQPFNTDAHIRPHLNKVLHTPREVAQYIGTEVLRSVDDLIHCKGAVMDLPEDGIFVVTDIRFWNEFDFFADQKDIQFVPFYISNYAAETVAAKDTHASERYILEIAKKCEKLDNNGSMEDFQNMVVNAFERVLAGRK